MKPGVPINTKVKVTRNVRAGNVGGRSVEGNRREELLFVIIGVVRMEVDIDQVDASPRMSVTLKYPYASLFNLQKIEVAEMITKSFFKGPNNTTCCLRA